MGHPGSKRSVELPQDEMDGDTEVERFDMYPKWEDKAETLKLLKSFLSYMEFRGKWLQLLGPVF